ncbi:hypothetical protein ES703_13476 [subsurface metagenome]
MAQERKVRQVMTDAGLYKEGTKETLRTDFIAEEDVTIAGKSYTLSKISFLDSKIFTDELDTILIQQNPLIHGIYAKNAVTLFDAVRMVNVNSKQGFKGALASGLHPPHGPPVPGPRCDQGSKWSPPSALGKKHHRHHGHRSQHLVLRGQSRCYPCFAPW